ncbi:MAG: sulfurtransferase [Gammaproteobacteria bacterium]|nr:sulfurtransferase [Gammaproteobacteria bacterium]MBV9726724.1 sulfurtransferase [Gammaproteobacteria bacterium]
MRPMFATLIEPQELAAHLDDPDWAIIDCRFDLARPHWGAQAYAAGHIPRALYAHLDQDLSGPRGARSGRHPLPQPQTLAATLARFGIDERVQVVAYDQGTGAFAARLWWLLRWVGHTRVAVLNGGFAAWQHAGLAVTSESEPRPPRQFRASPHAHAVVSGTEVGQLVSSGRLRSGERLLVDARSADRFAGENETLDSVAGHVPGARNHPFAANLDSHGRFLDPAQLRRSWEQTLRGEAPGKLIVMCGSGVTACHNLLALETAGLSGARLYAGSWSEWITDPANPVARGPESER